MPHVPRCCCLGGGLHGSWMSLKVVRWHGLVVVMVLLLLMLLLLMLLLLSQHLQGLIVRIVTSSIRGELSRFEPFTDDIGTLGLEQ